MESGSYMQCSRSSAQAENGVLFSPCSCHMQSQAPANIELSRTVDPCKCRAKCIHMHIISPGTHLLMRPMLGRMPTSAAKADGVRMLLPVSDPNDIKPKLAVIAEADPPLEPPVERSRSYALRTTPNTAIHTSSQSCIARSFGRSCPGY